MKQRPRIWSITASDSSAGAGHQADLTVAHSSGCDCAILQVALTAQNSLGVRDWVSTDMHMLEQQWQALQEDGWPDAIRLGWLPPDAMLLAWLTECLQSYDGPVIWDPVLSATQGGLPHSDAVRPLLYELLRRADVLTPNKQEAAWLAGLSTTTSVANLAKALHRLGAGHLLITAGDSLENTSDQTDSAEVEDRFFPSATRSLGQGELPGPDLLTEFRLRHARLEEPSSISGSSSGSGADSSSPTESDAPSRSLQVHGTGCHLAAALTCALASGHTLYDAVVRAVASTRLAMRHASIRASGYHNAWATALSNSHADDWPRVYAPDQPSLPPFPALTRPLGVYGLTDNLAHLKQLLACGIDTLQWRVKAPLFGKSSGAVTGIVTQEMAEHMAEAIALCRQAGVPLFINDHWSLAAELGADGVHLGQEDLSACDLEQLATSGLMLGISTHSDWEIARARAVRPSYIAFGPVFPPLSKQLRYTPLGLQRLKQWRRRFEDETLTCIGGITTENVAEVAATGIASVALVTDLAGDAQLTQRLEHHRNALQTALR